jgi:hypothetical protein
MNTPTQPHTSVLGIIYEKTIYDIWKHDSILGEPDTFKNSTDPVLKAFALSLPDDFLIADLRTQPHKTGFCYGRSPSDVDKAKRYGDELLWAVPKPDKRTFWAKLFGK